MKKLIFLILLSSCSMQKFCADRYPCQGSSDSIVRDSISYVYRDSTMTIPKDSSAITALLSCVDENGKLTKDKVKLMEIINYRSGVHVGIPSVQIRDNYLQSKCEVDTLKVVNHWLEKHVSHYVKIKKAVVQKVNFLTWWQTLWVWIGKITSGILALLLLWFILKKVFPVVGTISKFL